MKGVVLSVKLSYELFFIFIEIYYFIDFFVSTLRVTKKLLKNSSNELYELRDSFEL